MGEYVAKNVVQRLIKKGKVIGKSRVLVMGATFKENVSDIRNSKVADVIEELKSYSINVDVTDPYADSSELKHEYGFELVKKIGKGYDAIIAAVSHREYLNLDEKYFKSLLSKDGIVVDLKGMYRGKIKSLEYWSL